MGHVRANVAELALVAIVLDQFACTTPAGANSADERFGRFVYAEIKTQSRSS